MITRLHKNINEFDQSFFIFGPRGTGKTTWINTHAPDSLYLDLLHSERYTTLLANPSKLETIILGEKKEWVVIDEIQKIPELLNEVHRLIEHHNQKFILTGSSARSLRKKGVNLLAGRALQTYMHPICVAELGANFVLEKALKFGMLPQAITRNNPQHYLNSYVETYLREEVLQEGLTRNLSSFSRFLEYASFSQGNQLNYSNVARDAKLDRKQIERYFELLEDLLLGTHLPSFTKKAKRQVVTHPKFYFFDIGVYRTIRPTGPLDISSEIEGVCLESLVFQELRAINDYFELGYTLHFWRTAQGAEVDFVLYGPAGLIAIEIKRSANIRKQDLKSLQLFKSDYPMAKCYLFHQGEFQENHDGISLVPIETALRKLPTWLKNNSQSE